MADVFLEITKHATARRLVKTLGLPLPLPEPLARARGPWSSLPLKDEAMVVGAAAEAELLRAAVTALAEAGADPFVDAKVEPGGAFADAAEGFARPVRPTSALGEGARARALVFDASSIAELSALRGLYDFFHPWVGRLGRSGRVVVLGRARPSASHAPGAAEAEAAQAALSGFVRSVAKEIGRFGATANLVLVEQGAEARVGPVLRWLLEARSAFVTGQPVVVSARASGAPRPVYVRPLDGRVALVTGAARGIGRATARALAAEGAHVICADRPEDGAEVGGLSRSIGGTALLVDVTSADAPSRIVEALGGRKLDILVHNAGITRDKTLARMKPEHWDQALDVNLAAVVRITGALEKGALRDGGRIICLSSVSGIAGNVGQSNYAASKAGLVGYVDALSTRLGGRGITVNAVAPGFIETRMTAAVPVVIREAGRRLSALGQGGLPEDVAQAVTFLASPGAQGVSGRTLRVCGGALVGA